MRPSELKKALEFSLVNNFPLLIKGQPGIGKSEIVIQACETIGYEYIILHPVVSDPTDFKGMPWVVLTKTGENEAIFIPLGEMKRLLTATKPLVVFFDDLGQSTPAVQSAIMQILLARQINGHKISEFVRFVAATNRRIDFSNVSGILEAVKSRFYSIVELVIDPIKDPVVVKEWVQWAWKNDMPSELISFIEFNPKWLNQFDPTRDLTNSPIPRTNANVGRMMKAGLTNDIWDEMVSGAAGEKYCYDFKNYLETYRYLPSIYQIESDPNNTDVPDKIGARFALTNKLTESMNNKNIGAFIIYLKRMGEEMLVSAMMNASKRNTSIMNTPEFLRFGVQYGNILTSC
jgi:hypothetical protein